MPLNDNSGYRRHDVPFGHYVLAAQAVCIGYADIMYPSGIMYLLRKHDVSAVADIMYHLW